MIHTALPEELEHSDASAPAGSVSYRVRTVSTSGSLISTVICTEYPYEIGIDPADVALPTTASGAVGGTGAGAVDPVAVPLLSDTVAPTPTPADAPGVCQAGGHRVAVKPNQDRTTYSRISVPPGARLTFDAVHVKEPSWDSGNWVIWLEIYVRNPDGSLGARLMRSGLLSPFYWNQSEYSSTETMVNNTTGTDFVLKAHMDSHIDLQSGTVAHTLLTNFRYQDPTTGDTTGLPCGSRDVSECEARGGDYYFAAPTTLDGETYRGCYSYDSCVSNFSGLLGGAQEWACENDELLDAALIATGITIMVVGGFVVMGPSAVAALLARSGFGFAGDFGGPDAHEAHRRQREGPSRHGGRSGSPRYHGPASSDSQPSSPEPSGCWSATTRSSLRSTRSTRRPADCR